MKKTKRKAIELFVICDVVTGKPVRGSDGTYWVKDNEDDAMDCRRAHEKVVKFVESLK